MFLWGKEGWDFLLHHHSDVTPYCILIQVIFNHIYICEYCISLSIVIFFLKLIYLSLNKFKSVVLFSSSGAVLYLLLY